LTEVQTLSGENVIMDIANDLDINVVCDLMEFKSRSGNVFGEHRSYIWKTNMSTDPVVWWKAYAATRKLSRVAAVLLSLGASIAAVERPNKEFSVQKSKKRNRLTDERATKLTYVAYNLKTAMGGSVKKENKTSRSDDKDKRSSS